MFDLRTKSKTVSDIKGWRKTTKQEMPPNLSGTLLSMFDLLSDVLDELLLLGPFLVLQAKCLVLEGTKIQSPVP